MKNKAKMTLGSTLLASILIFGFYGIGSSIADGRYESDDDDHDEQYSFNFRGASQSPKQTAMTALYKEECGSCHMAYPVSLLPNASWNKIMNGLEDHFGENAEVDSQTSKELIEYFADSAQRNKNTYRKMLRNIGSRTPMRITELPYFKHEHDEIPSRFIKNNDKIGSLSQCNSCHRNAEKGGFDEDNVVIPGYGRWDD